MCLRKTRLTVRDLIWGQTGCSLNSAETLTDKLIAFEEGKISPSEIESVLSIRQTSKPVVDINCFVKSVFARSKK